MGVVPKEPEAGTNKRTHKHDDFRRAGYKWHHQVGGERLAAGNVDKDRECQGNDRHDADAKPVKTVRQVNRVGRRSKNESAVENKHDADCRIKCFDEGDEDMVKTCDRTADSRAFAPDIGNYGRIKFAGRVKHAANDQTEEPLSGEFHGRRDTVGIMLGDLEVVICETDCRKADRDNKEKPDEQIGKTAKQQRCNDQRSDDQEAAHCWRACLATVHGAEVNGVFGCCFSDWLSRLECLEHGNQTGTTEQRENECQKERKAGSHSLVLHRIDPQDSGIL